MFLNRELADSINIVLKNVTGTNGALKVIRPLTGGSINQCYETEYNKLSYFLKTNSRFRFPGMFMAEANGLKKIAQAGSIGVPNVIAWGETSAEQYLILEWISPGINSSNAQVELGQKLAALHGNSSPYFGLDHNNYMGSLTQCNKQERRFADFFINHRLKPQIKLATDKKLLDNQLLNLFDQLYSKLPNLYKAEAPSLVHGDLWSGNYLIDSKQRPFLIDPAMSYSHREVDIAMTALFGGFDSCFYQGYEEVFPLEKGWQERIPLWNLYPLLVHLNLFGPAYLSDIKQNLNRFL